MRRSGTSGGAGGAVQEGSELEGRCQGDKYARQRKAGISILQPRYFIPAALTGTSAAYRARPRWKAWAIIIVAIT